MHKDQLDNGPRDPAYTDGLIYVQPTNQLLYSISSSSETPVSSNEQTFAMMLTACCLPGFTFGILFLSLAMTLLYGKPHESRSRVAVNSYQARLLLLKIASLSSLLSSCNQLPSVRHTPRSLALISALVFST